MKNKNLFLLVLLTALTCIGFSKETQLQRFITQINDNEFIKKMKENFKTFTEKRPGERLYLHTDKAFYKPCGFTNSTLTMPLLVLASSVVSFRR